jgi:hypothetical protein
VYVDVCAGVPGELRIVHVSSLGGRKGGGGGRGSLSVKGSLVRKIWFIIMSLSLKKKGGP